MKITLPKAETRQTRQTRPQTIIDYHDLSIFIRFEHLEISGNATAFPIPKIPKECLGSPSDLPQTFSDTQSQFYSVGSPSVLRRKRDRLLRIFKR